MDATGRLLGIMDSTWTPGFTPETAQCVLSRGTYLDTLASKRIQLIQKMVDEHQPRLVVMYGTSYQKHWEYVLGERLLFHPEIELSCGRRGRSEILLVKHPASKQRTSRRSVGTWVRFGEQLSPTL